MLESWQIVGFLGAAALITLAPGPDILMVLGLGLAQGWRAGMAFGLGCALGCLSHTALAALGGAAMIAASPRAFHLLTFCGGAYLVWLGVLALRHPAIAAVSSAPAGSGGRLFRRGLLANAINPKVVLFFLAFLPQFVVPGRGDEAWQVAQFGVLFTLQAAVLFGLVGALAGRIGQSVGRWPAVGLWLGRLAGIVFIGLGLRLLIAP